MEQPFLDQIAENPNNNEIRLVYADYLEERQDPRGEFLKLEIDFHAAKTTIERDWFREMLREQKSEMDPAWLLKVERTVVELCPESIKSEQRDRSPARRAVKRIRGTSGSPTRPSDEVEFQFQCDKSWLDLTPTADEKVRSCESCKELVYFSRTIEEAKDNAKQFRCVAICSTAYRNNSDLGFLNWTVTMGLIASPGDWDFEQEPSPDNDLE